MTIRNRCLPSKKSLSDVIPAILLLFLSFLFFHRVLFGAEYMFPWDFVDHMYPTQRFVADAIRSGNWPLWDPYVSLGYPIIGDPQASIFNPLYLLYHLIPAFPPLSLSAFEWLETTYIAMAGVFAYSLARTIRITRAGSLLAGIIYMLGGFFPVHVEHETWVAASVWIPLLFLLAVRIFEKPTTRYVVAIAFVIAFSLFSGYPQTTLLSVYLLAGFLIWFSVSKLRPFQFDILRKTWVLLLTAAVLGIAVSAIQLLPSIQFGLNSSRGTADFAGTAGGGLQPTALVTLLFPKLLGSDGTGPYVGGEVTHSQKYSGLVSLVLAGAGSLGLLSQPRTRTSVKFIGFFGVLMPVAFVASFGANATVYRIFELLPFMTTFRRAATLFPFALLGAAMLAGTACDRLTLTGPVQEAATETNSRWTWFKSWTFWRITGVLAGILCIVYLVGALNPVTIQAIFASVGGGALPAQLTEPSFAPSIQKNSIEMLPIAFALLAILVGMRIVSKAGRVLAFALIVLTFLDLYAFNANQIFNTYERAEYDSLSQLPTLLHLVSADPLGTSRLATRQYPYFQNAGNILHVETLSGYNPLRLRRVEELLGVIPSINSRQFDLLNVRYIIVSNASGESRASPQTLAATSPAGRWNLERESPASNKYQFLASGISDNYLLYENKEVLPRSFVINEYEVVPDANRRLALFGSANFDPSRTVLLEEPFSETLLGRSDGMVRISKYALNEFELNATLTGGSALLFLSVPYAPGWNAFVNGAPAKIYIADHAFMAVQVGPGENMVRVTYEPLSFKLGALITAAGLALCLVALVGGERLLRRLGLFVDQPEQPI